MRPLDLGVGCVDGGCEDRDVDEDAKPLGVADEVNAQQVEEHDGPLPILRVGEELKR